MTDGKENVDFSKVRCFKFEENHHNTMFIKHFLNEESFKVVNIGKRGQKIQLQIQELETLEKKYVGPLAINEKKLKNLRTLLPYIPQAYSNYYTNIGVNAIANAIDHDGDEDQDGEVENIDGDIGDSEFEH